MGDRTRSRRQFFRGGEIHPVPKDVHLLRVGRPAMGSTFEILFPADRRSRIEIPHRALDEVRRLEAIMTIFREDSELSRVNREAARGRVPISKELLGVLQLSLEVSHRTAGAFDITSGVLSRLWGFRDRTGHIPSDEAIQESLTQVGWRFVNLDLDDRTVQFERAGLELNLGSIGKGFALDHAAEMLQNADFGRTLLHAGYSSILAVGDLSYPGGGWLVTIRHPLDKNRELVKLRLRNQALGTSGMGEQHFERDGKSYGHVIDPRTGRPAEQNLIASCVAPSAALADALATAFLVMSVDSIEELCREDDRIGGIVVPCPAPGETLKPVSLGVATACVETE